MAAQVRGREEVSRVTITERQAHGARPRSVSVTVTTDETGRMTIEATDLPAGQVPALLHQATQVVKRMRNAMLRSEP